MCPHCIDDEIINKQMLPKLSTVPQTSIHPREPAPYICVLHCLIRSLAQQREGGTSKCVRTTVVDKALPQVLEVIAQIHLSMFLHLRNC